MALVFPISWMLFNIQDNFDEKYDLEEETCCMATFPLIPIAMILDIATMPIKIICIPCYVGYKIIKNIKKKKQRKKWGLD